MKLCTFEVATQLGRHSRVGVCRDGRIIDINFANAWHLAQQGESEPHKLADALTPSGMMDFLRAGLRAIHATEELFGESGPRPAEWWMAAPLPRGPNDETLSYVPRKYGCARRCPVRRVSAATRPCTARAIRTAK